MPQKILVIGGVALGPKAACRAKRLSFEAQLTLAAAGLNLPGGLGGLKKSGIIL